MLNIASNNVTEIRLDYSDCSKVASPVLSDLSVPSGVKRWAYDPASNVCSLEFAVPSDMQAPVYLYYRLSNFYQNNRKYVKSFDLKQLQGNAVNPPDAICAPLDKVDITTTTVKVNGVSTAPNAGAVYYPCGLIANSIFSGTLELTRDAINNAIACTDVAGSGCFGNPNYNFTSDQIAWPADAQKYQPSKYLTTYPNSTDLTLNVIPPPFWRTAFPQYADGYTTANFPNLNVDTHFQVWMRTAGLPTFRKLWGVSGSNTLATGTWSLNITQSTYFANLDFDTSRYGGTKSIVLSTASVLGGKNSFLGAAYILTAIVCLCFGVAFLIRNMVKPRKLGDHRLLSWNQNQAIAEQNTLLSQSS